MAGAAPGMEQAALGSDPRVLVIAPDDERIGVLCQGLDALGWRTVTARTLEAAEATLADFPLEAAIVDADSFAPDEAVALLGMTHVRSLVMAAALGVFGTGSGWPDLAVAAVMGVLALTAARSVIQQARAELRPVPAHA